MSNLVKIGQKNTLVKKAHRKIKPTGLQKYKLNNQLTKKRAGSYENMYWLLDTSGSMGGEKISQLIETVEYLLPRYPLVNLVQFNSKVERISEERVPHLWATGSTHMLEALSLAWQCNPQSIVLITDGNPTDAPRQKILDEASQYNCPISTIGIGEYYDRDFLETLSSITGGTTTDISTENLTMLTDAVNEAVLQLTDGKQASSGTINL